MFDVEANAADRAKQMEKALIKQGVRPGAAARRAEVQRQREVREGNQWILDNVGLD